MLKNIVPKRKVKEKVYRLVFDDADGNGFAFPCDEEGNIGDLPKEAARNYAWCKEHPEKFERFGFVETVVWSFTEPAHGECHCGARVDLVNQYMGACQCGYCGQWYNLFGQDLTPPPWED